MPKTSKGTRRGFEINISLWIDLLGYGTMLQSVGWDPTSAGAEAARNRISKFHEVVSRRSNRYFRTFLMNDGGIAFRDLSPRTPSVTFDFLRRSIDLHLEVNESEKEQGFPGARSVLASGFRVRPPFDRSERLISGQGKRIKENLKAGVIDQGQAINQALMARHDSQSMPELQHNYAMTKAYLVESSGSKRGFSGSRLFLDANLFSEKVPDWITLEKPIQWEEKGMHGSFFPFISLDLKAAGSSKHSGIHSAFEIAQKLSPGSHVVERLRASKVGGQRRKLFS